MARWSTSKAVIGVIEANGGQGVAVSKVDERWALVPPSEGPEDAPVFPRDPRVPGLSDQGWPKSRNEASGRQPVSQVQGRAQGAEAHPRESDRPTWVPDTDFSAEAFFQTESSDEGSHGYPSEDRPTIPSPAPSQPEATIASDAPDTIPTPWIDDEPSGV
jgi:hypothetical protein